MQPKNLWAMMLPEEQEQMMSMGQPAEMPPMMPQMPVQSRSVEYSVPMNTTKAKAPSYQQQFDDAFMSSMQARDKRLEGLQRDYEAEKGNKPTGLAALNLRPFLSFSDQLLGTKSQFSYQDPTAPKEHQEKLQRLQEMIAKESNSLSDDQLNYLKTKAQEEMYKVRETQGTQRMSDALGRQATNNEFKLRGEWDSDEITKNSKAVSEGYEKIANSYNSDSKASDLSMIYGIMRLQDPGSVVRESEADMAAKIGGYPAQTQAFFMTLQGKGRLTPDQRQAIRQEAEVLYNAQMSRQKSVDDKYRNMASQYGFSPERVVLSDIFKRQASDNDKKALAWANQNPNDPRAKAIKQKLGAK